MMRRQYVCFVGGSCLRPLCMVLSALAQAGKRGTG